MRSEQCDSPKDHVRRWLAFSELYQLPHLLRFDGYTHLVEMLRVLGVPGNPAVRAALAGVSARMQASTGDFISKTHARVQTVLGHLLTPRRR